MFLVQLSWYCDGKGWFMWPENGETLWLWWEEWFKVCSQGLSGWWNSSWRLTLVWCLWNPGWFYCTKPLCCWSHKHRRYWGRTSCKVDKTRFLTDQYFDFISVFQGIMDKFEYFPIKCRIKRAADMFQKSRAGVFQTARACTEKAMAAENVSQVSQPNFRPVKSKVLLHKQPHNALWQATCISLPPQLQNVMARMHFLSYYAPKYRGQYQLCTFIS